MQWHREEQLSQLRMGRRLETDPLVSHVPCYCIAESESLPPVGEHHLHGAIFSFSRDCCTCFVLSHPVLRWAVYYAVLRCSRASALRSCSAVRLYTVSSLTTPCDPVLSQVALAPGDTVHDEQVLC